VTDQYCWGSSRDVHDITERRESVGEGGANSARNLFFIQAACNGATIAAVLLTLLTPKWWILAGIGFIATLLAQVRLYRQSTKDTLHEFTDERSPAFVRFFSEWYDRDGNHDIYCKDLHWLDRPELEPIVEVIIRRRPQMSIFVREQQATVCRRLINAGVQLYLVPEVARSEMKMSLRSDNDDKELIVRRRRPGSEVVRFIHSQDQYLLGVAEDLFTLYRTTQQNRGPGGESPWVD
jgi:hypothetical protein